MQKIDPDHIIALVTEVIPAHSCLVFCPTKKNCENVAVMICKYLKEWVDLLQSFWRFCLSWVTSNNLFLDVSFFSLSEIFLGIMRTKKCSSSESWRTAAMALCVRCSGRQCRMVWPITTVDWPQRRGNWWRRPTPLGFSVCSPAPPP